MLRTLNDPEVAFRAGAECLKRFLVSLAFTSLEGSVITVEFNNDNTLPQPGFVRVDRRTWSKSGRRKPELPALPMPHRPLGPIHPKSLYTRAPNNLSSWSPPRVYGGRL